MRTLGRGSNGSLIAFCWKKSKQLRTDRRTDTVTYRVRCSEIPLYKFRWRAIVVNLIIQLCRDFNPPFISAAWKADRLGNLTFRKTAQNFNLPMCKVLCPCILITAIILTIIIIVLYCKALAGRLWFRLTRIPVTRRSPIL